MKTTSALLALAIAAIGGSAHAKGKEHGGKEHAGKEHAGKEHGGAKAKSYNAEEIKAAMNAHITAQTKDGGVLRIKDEKTGEALELEFVKIHDPVRVIEKKGYFACTDFNPKGMKEKLYDLDFWLNPNDKGELKVYETRIHKHPEQKDGKWEKKERYTFINDNPVEVK